MLSSSRRAFLQLIPIDLTFFTFLAQFLIFFLKRYSDYKDGSFGMGNLPFILLESNSSRQHLEDDQSTPVGMDSLADAVTSGYSDDNVGQRSKLMCTRIPRPGQDQNTFGNSSGTPLALASFH